MKFAQVAVGTLVVVHFIVLLGACYQAAMQPPTVETETTTYPAYDRGEWGRWKDADRDCQDARQEVLVAESTEPVTLDEKGCKVLSGVWECPFTGKRILDPGLIDIDHMVALREAHVSGGHAWDKAHKLAYFNDLTHPEHLIAVDRSANRSKGSRQPHEWLPPNDAYRCEYLRAWVTVKTEWALETDCEEARELAKLMAQYCR